MPSTSAVSFLPEAMLALLIASYFAGRVARGSRLPANLHLLGAMSCLAAFAVASFGEYSLVQEASLVCICVQAPLVSLAAVFLIQFTYHFPAMWEARRMEARIALGISGAGALWESAYAWYRLQQLWGEGAVIWRDTWTDYLLAAGFVWCATVMVRQERRFKVEAEREARSGVSRVLWPSNRRARAARAAAVVFALAAAVLWLAEFRPFGIPSSWRPIILSEGLLLALLLFVLLYLNELPEVTSLMVKLLGLTLAVTLASLNLIVGVTAQLLQANFEARPPGLDPWLPPGVTAPQTLRFYPKPGGGYEFKRLRVVWKPALGQRLAPSDFVRGGTAIPLEFPMPFFGREWTRIHVGMDGYLAFGRYPRPNDFRYQYGSTPAIVAYLAGLDPNPAVPESGVYVSRSLEHVAVTWLRMRVGGRSQECTLQVVLHRDGTFDMSHAVLPRTRAPGSGEEPLDGWLVGVVSGGLSRPMQTRFAGGMTGEGMTVGPGGVVQDQIYQWRQYTSRDCGPLSLLVVLAALVALAILPMLLSSALVRPLNDLVEAARRVNGGLLDEPAPLHHQDEVGFLAQTFNAMMRQLKAARTGKSDPTLPPAPKSES